jgi:hypothetical protein
MNKYYIVGAKKISPYTIGDISNLQTLPWRENLLKSNTLCEGY